MRRADSKVLLLLVGGYLTRGHTEGKHAERKSAPFSESDDAFLLAILIGYKHRRWRLKVLPSLPVLGIEIA